MKAKPSFLCRVGGGMGSGGKMHPLASVQTETSQGQYIFMVRVLLCHLGGMWCKVGFPQL